MSRIEGAWRRLVMEFRGGDAVLAFVNGREVARYARAGVVTPDHVLRIKPWPLIVPAPEAGKLDAFKGAAQSAVADFIAAYQTYFARNVKHLGEPRIMLDPLPRVILVPGLGLFGLGCSKREAVIAADIAEAAVGVITDAEATGNSSRSASSTCSSASTGRRSRPSSAAPKEPPLAGQVAAITGAGGAIGAATAARLRGRGRRGGAARRRPRRRRGQGRGDRRHGASRSPAT